MSFSKIPVGVLGATGSVGQKIVSLLENHPWFEVKKLAASSKNSHKKYLEACTWTLNEPCPETIKGLSLSPAEPSFFKECPLIFSALDTSVAAAIEESFLEEGFFVVTNASPFRAHPLVPVIIPEVNKEHLSLISKQTWKGKMIANSNCVVAGLAIALKPLFHSFDIESVWVATLQAISGAGYPGVASLDILDNVIPYIDGEEEKIEQEIKKILSLEKEGNWHLPTFPLTALCHRVPVNDGHLASLSIKLKEKISLEEFTHVLKGYYNTVFPKNPLPSSPEVPLHVFSQMKYPQPKYHRDLGKGMTVSVGGIRPCSLGTFKFSLLSHNRVRGAAGLSLQNGELLYQNFMA